jgi:hypothetical protein
MTLQLCVPPCAYDDLHPRIVVRLSPDPLVVRGSPVPAHATTEGLPPDSAGRADSHPRNGGDLPSSDEPRDFPDDNGDWEEFDPTPLESWILDDFDWEVEESYPERGDYWDDSLDRETDIALASCNIQFRLSARRDRGAHAARSPASAAWHWCAPRGRASPAVYSQTEPGNKDAEP